MSSGINQLSRFPFLHLGSLKFASSALALTKSRLQQVHFIGGISWKRQVVVPLPSFPAAGTITASTALVVVSTAVLLHATTAAVRCS